MNAELLALVGGKEGFERWTSEFCKRMQIDLQRLREFMKEEHKADMHRLNDIDGLLQRITSLIDARFPVSEGMK